MTRIFKNSKFVIVERDGVYSTLNVSLSELLSMQLSESKKLVESATSIYSEVDDEWLAPVDPHHEIWACGVTYLRSKQGRMEESEIPDLYSKVYDADRPEIFYKSVGWRVIPNGQPVGIRRDSGWDVPEAEVVLVVNSHQELFGYTVGNDMSSRSIEGENTLYLPQAKSYEKACSIGEFILPAWEVSEAIFPLDLNVVRSGEVVFTGQASTSQMKRNFQELISWLFQSLSMPNGVFLFTGTGIVPDASFTLQEGDVVTIDAGTLGRLSNPVVLVP